MELNRCDNESPIDMITLEAIFKEGSVSVPINRNYDISCSLYLKDYESMLPFQWLRTQAIDILLKLLLERTLTEIGKIYAARGNIAEEQHRKYIKIVDAFVATMIMTIDQEPILQSLAPLQLFSPSTKCLLIPINTEHAQGSHWMLGCFINGAFEGGQTKSELIMFDSGQGGMGIGLTLKKKLQNLFKVLEGKQIQIALLRAQKIPNQSNSYDCGVYTVGFGEYILKELVNQLEEEGESIKLDRLNSDYKYLLGNSKLSRQRYRRMLEDLLLTVVQ